MKGKGDMKGKGSMNGKGNMTGKGSMTGKYSTQGKDNKPRRQAKAKAVRQQDRSPPPSPAPPYRHWGLDHRRHRQEGNFDRQICLTALFKSKGQSGIMPNPPPPPYQHCLLQGPESQQPQDANCCPQRSSTPAGKLTPYGYQHRG